MGKIVVNKNFQSKYLYRAFERLVKPDYDITNYKIFATYNSTNNIYDFSEVSNSPIYMNLNSVYGNVWSGVGLNHYSAASGDPTYNRTHLVPNQYFLCDETFLTLLNKINKTAKSGMTSFPKVVNSQSGGVTVTGSNKTANLNIHYLCSSLFSNSITIRNNTIDYFVSGSFITAEEGTQIKNILSTFKLVDNNYAVDSYGGIYVPKTTDLSTVYVDNVLNMTVNKVLRLDNPYKQSNDNIANQTLYVLVIPFSDTKTSGYNPDKIVGFVIAGGDISISTTPRASFTPYKWEDADGKCYTGYQTFHNKATNTVVNQIPYIALSLTEVGAGGDIEYDHLDEIEYLDEIKISIALPKEYV